jgi:hypothetical protein
VTALAAFHYRMPFYGLTGTVRAGRFLAKDSGARFEVKRRFRSGFEVGAWYTFTDGNDITSPGSPSSPYYDKGIYGSIPLNTMLTRDTQASGSFSLAPLTRDVGQMVISPADLYDLMERPLANLNDQDGLVKLGDLDDDPYRPDPPNAIQEGANWDCVPVLPQQWAARYTDEMLIGTVISMARSGWRTPRTATWTNGRRTTRTTARIATLPTSGNSPRWACSAPRRSRRWIAMTPDCRARR